MNSLFCLIVFTSNILGSFNDPFEFDGNYGAEINPIQEYVFEQVVSKEAMVKNLSDFQVIEQMENKNPSVEEIEEYRRQLGKKAIEEDLQHGPTLNQLVSHDLRDLLLKKQEELQNEGFSKEDLANFLSFLDCYKEKKLFSFFRHSPSELLSLDKILKDRATRERKNFDLPILSSTAPLVGENAFQLKALLLEDLFTKETLSLVSSKDKNTLLKEGVKGDLAIFTTPAGQVFFYWLYQSLNLHLVAENKGRINEINKAKQIFARTLGDPFKRAIFFKDNLIEADASILFTQESDAILPKILTKEGLFHPVDIQNPLDGTFVFLKKDSFEPSYEVISIEGYEGFLKGRLNVILATKKETKEKFLLASSHGNSTRAEDGRLQITKIVEKFHELRKICENKNLQLIIGIDANTKSQEEVNLLRDQLQSLGLIATYVGPTTVKKRMVTAQHSKAGRFAVDEEDYVIVLKPEKGGLYQITDSFIGFKKEKLADPLNTLPNVDNMSDHYPVGAVLTPIFAIK